MKKFYPALTVFAVVGMVLLLNPIWSQATTVVNNNLAWQMKPESDSFWSFSLDHSLFDEEFYLTNLVGARLELISIGNRVESDTIWVWESGSTWYANTSQSTTGAIELDNGLFGFQFGDDDQYGISEAYIGPYSYLLLDLDSGDDLMWVNITGASPVPIPSAALLLGSGLIGIIGIRRRFMRG